jgi:hypothetical protein
MTLMHTADSHGACSYRYILSQYQVAASFTGSISAVTRQAIKISEAQRSYVNLVCKCHLQNQ